MCVHVCVCAPISLSTSAVARRCPVCHGRTRYQELGKMEEKQLLSLCIRGRCRKKMALAGRGAGRGAWESPAFTCLIAGMLQEAAGAG